MYVCVSLCLFISLSPPTVPKVKIFLNVQNTKLSTLAGSEAVLICRSQPHDQALPCQAAQQKYLCLAVFNILCFHHSSGKFNCHEV